VRYENSRHFLQGNIWIRYVGLARFFMNNPKASRDNGVACPIRVALRYFDQRGYSVSEHDRIANSVLPPGISGKLGSRWIWERVAGLHPTIYLYTFGKMLSTHPQYAFLGIEVFLKCVV
jgi:hypothetical protein